MSDVTGKQPVPALKPPVSVLGWCFVAVAFAVALLAAASIWGQGAALARTAAILNGSDRAGYAALLAQHGCEGATRLAALCNGADALQDKADLGCLLALPAADAAQADTEVPQPATLPFWSSRPPPTRFTATPACGDAWQAARAIERTATRARLAKALPGWLAGWLDRLAAPGREGPTMLWPLIGMLAGTLALGGAVGLGAYGRLFGLWINAQNRFSLSTAQVCLWTALVIAPFGAITLLHAGMGLSGDTSPDIPGLLFSLMGITFGSTMLSKFILAVKAISPEDRTGVGIGRFIGTSRAGLATNGSPRQAAILDFFTGEENSDRGQLDVSRFQNVVFTIVLGGCYFAAVVAALGQGNVAAVLGSFRTPQPMFAELPSVTGSFLGLLLVSHAAYLTVKAAPKDGPGRGDADTPLR